MSPLSTTALGDASLKPNVGPRKLLRAQALIATYCEAGLTNGSGLLLSLLWYQSLDCERFTACVVKVAVGC